MGAEVLEALFVLLNIGYRAKAPRMRLRLSKTTHRKQTHSGKAAFQRSHSLALMPLLLHMAPDGVQSSMATPQPPTPKGQRLGGVRPLW